MEKVNRNKGSKLKSSNEDIDVALELIRKDSEDIQHEGVKMNFDDMLEELGEMGKFQLITYILVCLPVIFSGANSLSYVFTAGISNYRCYIPTCEDINNTQYNQPWLSMAIPAKGPAFTGNSYVPAHCEMYKINSSYMNTKLSSFTNTQCSPDRFTNEIVPCDEWIFDEERTIVKDWNIVCLDNQWKLSLVGSMHFIGIILGSAFFGFMADKFGRKRIFVTCTLIMGISGAAQVLSPEYITFLALIFIHSVGTAGVYPLAFIIGVELVGRKKRETTATVLNYFYAIGEALIALFAWLTLDWTYLQLIVSIPCAFFILYYWWIPESVRWLLVHQKSLAAKCIICRAAKMNGVTLSDSLLKTFNDDIDLKNDIKEEITTEDEEEGSSVLKVLKIMTKSRKMIIRFSIVLYLWAANAFIYYGLSLNSTSISGNKYLNFALVCLIEIPGYTIAWISIQHLGRRTSLIAFFFLCGATCIISIFIPEQISWAIIFLFLIGKLGITSSFGVIYVYTAELLPTVIRSGGVGAASTTGRFGALLAPFVPLLGVYVQPLPMILFGIISILAGILALKLPETMGIKLPETVDDAIGL